MRKALFFVLLVLADGIFILTDFEETHDSKVMAFGIALDNDGTRSASSNISVTLRRTVFTGKCYMKLSIAANKNDKDFSIVVLNTVFDISKLLNGVVANPYMKSVLSGYLKAIDFEPKFPMSPGIYRVTNLTTDENLERLIPVIKVFAEVRFVGKVSGFKKNILIHHMKGPFEKR